MGVEQEGGEVQCHEATEALELETLALVASSEQ